MFSCDWKNRLIIWTHVHLNLRCSGAAIAVYISYTCHKHAFIIIESVSPKTSDFPKILPVLRSMDVTSFENVQVSVVNVIMSYKL